MRRGTCMILVGNPARDRRLVKPAHRWENNIKIDLQEMGYGRAWTGLIWLKVMNIRVP
jgi:hypothetical protein